MSRFDDFLAKAKDGFDVAAKKTGEVITVQKLKLSISSIKGEIDKKYESIGRMYADTVKNNNDYTDAINSLIEEIDEKQEEIKALEKEIGEVTNKSICGSCGFKNPSESAFCSKCGSPLN